MTGANTLTDLPGLPKNSDGPVFAEPWQAQAFAMAVRLHEAGSFTWPEWAETLGAEIAAAGPDDPAENYYMHWLSALEKLVIRKQLLDVDEMEQRRDAWDRAARATPHGEPIELGRETRT